MLTQQELDRRRHFITASDVPAILGKSPWRNAADVYWAKVRGTADKTNDAMEAGNMLEPIVLQWADRELGGVLPGDWRVAENGINAASLDGVTLIGKPVEAKTSGITGPGSPHQWGEAGTDDIPDYYLLQVQAQLLVTGQTQAFVPALIGNRGFVMYVVERNDRLIGVIEASSIESWTASETKIRPTTCGRHSTRSSDCGESRTRRWRFRATSCRHGSTHKRKHPQQQSGPTRPRRRCWLNCKTPSVECGPGVKSRISSRRGRPIKWLNRLSVFRDTKPHSRSNHESDSEKRTQHDGRTD